MRGANRDRIGADPKEAGVTEADLAGESHQHVKAEHRECVDESECGDAYVIGRWEERVKEDDDQRDANHHRIWIFQHIAHVTPVRPCCSQTGPAAC